MLSTHFPNYFEKLSKIHLENEGPFLLGKKLTFPDIILADLLDAVDNDLGEGILDQYPVMRAHKEAVWKIPEVQEYVQKRN